MYAENFESCETILGICMLRIFDLRIHINLPVLSWVHIQIHDFIRNDALVRIHSVVNVLFIIKTKHNVAPMTRLCISEKNISLLFFNIKQFYFYLIEHTF